MLRKQASRLCAKFGIRSRTNEKPGAHLEFNDPRLEAVRCYISKAISEKRCHQRLVLNFDQVWQLQFRPNKKVLGKDQPGMPDNLIRSMALRRLRHNVELALDLPISEVGCGGV